MANDKDNRPERSTRQITPATPHFIIPIYPKRMISKVLGAHRKNRKVSRVLQIAVRMKRKKRKKKKGRERELLVVSN